VPRRTQGFEKIVFKALQNPYSIIRPVSNIKYALWHTSLVINAEPLNAQSPTPSDYFNYRIQVYLFRVAHSDVLVTGKQ
jgi:hypothetical protein